MRRSIAWTFLIASLLLAMGPGAMAMDIVVGQVAPLSGMESTSGRAYGAGMDMLFKQINQAGGVNGHRFALARMDDGGRPDDTVTLTRELLTRDKPLALAGYFGNRNMDSLIASGILQREKVALVGYRASDLRAETPYVYSVRAGLREEIRKLTQHLATIGITRLGLFHEGGHASEGLLHAAEGAAKDAAVRLVVHASYPPGTAQVSPAVQEFMKTPPQAILVVASGAAAAGFIEQYRISGGSAQIFTQSGADVEQMAKRLNEEQLQGVAIAQVTPSPYRISSKVAKELNDLAAKAGQPEMPVSYAMMEGFITAKVIVEAVRRQGHSPTREGTVAALDAMDGFDVGGYVVGFKPGMRTGSKYVELSIVTSTGKIRQ